MKGAEVILHPTGDAGDLPGWEACKVARAFENNVYFISANVGGWITRDGYLETTNAGGTKIIDYRGNIISEHKQAGESMRCRALIDIEQLRVHRHSDNNFNEIAQLRTEMYVPGYSKTITPPNTFKDPMKDKAQLRRLYMDTVDRLTEEGIFPPPMFPTQVRK
jgi:hypothetical protein